MKFRPDSAVVMTGGEDGLICAYNTSVGVSEDAVISILNTECPTRRIGYFGTGNEGFDLK